MNILKTLYYWSLLIGLIVASCNNHGQDNNAKEIYIDFDNIATIDLSQQDEIALEFTDSSMIRSVDELRLADEGHYLIRSRSDLFRYDQTGNFKNQIGRKGNGPMEFTSFSSFFVKNDLVHIYDFMGKKMLLYDFEGNHLNTISLKEDYQDITPNYIYPIHNNQYISKNTFGGDKQQIPSYSILDDSFSIVSSIQDRYIKNGMTVYNNFFADKDNTLFWEIFNDTIFSVTTDSTIASKYFVNFNTKAIPNNIKRLDDYDIIDHINKPENKTKYATLIQYVYEDNDYLRFIFTHNSDIYYVKSDKTNGTTKTYQFVYPDKTVTPLIFYDDNSLIIPVSGFEDAANPSLIVLDEMVLKSEQGSSAKVCV